MTPLSAPLPLRTTAVWAGFREPVPIPHRYGVTGGRLLQYSQDRRVFVWADHPAAGVDAVLVGGQAVGNWEHRNGTDDTGRAVAFVEFTQPVEEGADLVARGRGKPGASGLMTNPADVLADILTSIAGRPAIDLSEFRGACAAAGLEVGGSLERADILRAVVRSLCASIGAVFSEGRAFLWPADAPTAGWRIGSEVEIDAALQLDTLANDLTLRFAIEDGQPRASVRIEAPDSVAAYGRRERVEDAPWLASPRVAIAVASRALRQRARPAWSVGTGSVERVLRIGDVVALDHPTLPVQASAVVLGRELDPQDGSTRVRFEMPVGDVPAVRLVSQSAALDVQQYEAITIETIGSERVITLREADGRPIVGASCRLNDNITRQTDGAGRVSFPASAMPPGVHVIQVRTSDGREFATEVTV
ncbi:TPA_asm: putative tip attachment protein J [Cyanophage Cy-LDV1]|nr:TPA_asm: putative tip attachment protein J [Cyanophage Cy-LDV1]